MKLRHTLAICLAVFVLPGAFGAVADDASIVDAWYAALAKPDRAAIETLLAREAKIVLNDLGVTQNRAEFLDAFSEWEATISEGGSIRHRLDGGAYLACYDFIDNKVLLRETFKIANGAISESIQDKVADGCEGF